MKQSNYLLIGLGGTGCAVVRELKKKLCVEWRTRGNTGPYPEVYMFQDDLGGGRVESRIATLSVDSNSKDLEGQGELGRKWRVFGETLRLGDKEKVLLDPTGVDRILGSIERYPGIEPWIRDDLKFVEDITRGCTEPAGCNQIRRMGRLALANGNGIQNVLAGVENRLDELSRSGQVGAEVHVACTLAAGTGSGSVVDVIAQVQRLLKNRPGSFTVFVHGFITATSAGDVNTGNFYANQYAALSELNAFRLAIYEPWDIMATSTSHRLAVPRPGEASGDLAGTFKSVALVTDTTEGGADVPLEQQVDNVAEFIFQLAVRQMGDVPKALRDALSMEDRAHYPADQNGGDRSTAFIGYGVQRVAIPEREIHEKLSYSFARQFLLKLLYYNWDSGYRDDPRSFSYDGFVDSRRALWKCTHEHLCLDLVEDVQGQQQFPTYETAWREELNKQAERTKDALGNTFEARKDWIADFDKRADRFWVGGFRSRGEGGGVADYFRVRKEPAEIRLRAHSIRGIIEKDLIDSVERMNSDYPIHHMPGASDYLARRIEEERVRFGNLQTKAVEQLKLANGERDRIRSQYAKAGRLAWGKQERLFKDYVKVSIQFYYWSTFEKAADYAQEFCKALIDDLRLLQEQITLFDTRLKLVAKNFQSEIDARIVEGPVDDEREDVSFLVDSKYVNGTIRERFEADKTVQDSRALQAMRALSQLRRDRPEFGPYNERMPVDTSERVGGAFVDELRRVSEENAREAHRKIREDDPDFEGIFGQNIVRKLYQDYGGRVDGELDTWLRGLIDQAMPMVSFDPNEETMDLPTQGPVLRRCVFVPKCRAVPDFEQQLRAKVESITGARGGCRAVDTQYQEVPEDRNPTEIVIISVAFFFSARFTRAVHGLKTQYKERLEQRSDQESRRAFFEVHTETHQPLLPDLMKLGRRDVLVDRGATVVLATALDLLRVPKEEGQQLLFGLVDGFGRVKDKVDTGMRLTAEILKAAEESESRFGRKVPVEVVALFALYLNEFREASLPGVEKMVADRLKEGANLDEIARRLDAFGGECFLLSGKSETDEVYAFFDSKQKEALRMARRLADRSSL